MKINTILLLITTSIALFFFFNWVNDVVPRYENKIIIDICTTGSLATKNNTLFSTNLDFKKHYYWCGDFVFMKEIRGYECSSKKLNTEYNSTEPTSKVEEIYYCFKEQKVRIQ